MTRKFGDDVDYSLYNLEAKEQVCDSHINDDFLKNFIKSNGSIEKCSYCGKRKRTVELSEVLNLIVIGINYLFEDPIEFKYFDNEAETGFDGDNFYFEELFYDRLDLEIIDGKLSNDIFEHLNNTSLYYLKDEYGSHSEYLADLWQHFKETVKHRARFVFYYEDIFKDYHLSDPINILKDVQKAIQDFELFRQISPSEKIYRCRQHSMQNDVKGANDLSSPPDAFCKTNNRMSAIGISMFYGSLNKQICIDEVVNKSDLTQPYFTTGYFNSKKVLNLIDLTNLPVIPSIYDKERNRHRDTLFFLKEFIRDISKPINPSDSSIEYVPTQIVTEYIKFNPGLKADGIIYPSSKKTLFENIALFMNQEECLSTLDFCHKSIETKNVS